MSKYMNLEEYENPVLYDFEYRYTDDVSFLLKWAAQTKGIILDLACGTGRATIPLAEQGYELIGVDLHKGMLSQAEKKTKGLPIKWFQQDCTKLNLDVKVDLVYMVGNSFQHFLTNEDQDSLLRSVHDHLNEDGTFIFDTRFPSQDELLQPSTEEYWRSYQDPTNGQNVDVFTISKYDSLQQIQHYTTIRRAGDGTEKRTNINLRYVYPMELKRLAKANGFNIIHLYQDWKENPITEDNLSMICVLQKGK